MTRRIRTDRFDAAVAEAPPLTEAAAIPTKTAAARLALDGDELIHFTIRPSAWFVAIVSAKWIVALVLLGSAFAAIAGGGVAVPQFWLVINVIIGVGVVRVGVALLQWASRLYVLTNRRVMRFRGIINVNVAECPLARISRADLLATWYQRPVGVGSIEMQPADDRGAPVAWEHVAQAEVVHDRLVRTIRKAQNNSGC